MDHWYQIAADDEIRQGEVLLRVPVYIPETYVGMPPPESEQLAAARSVDLVVITPSCDLVEREKTGKRKMNVVLCEHWDLGRQIEKKIIKEAQVAEIERGRMPLNYILPASPFDQIPMNIRVVDFGSIHALPKAFVQEHAKAAGPRLRMLSPFCEHFAQAFARCYMRIGLPTTAVEYSSRPPRAQ